MKCISGIGFLLVFGAALLPAADLFAQVVAPTAKPQPKVVSTTGGFLTGSGGSVSFTVGESMIPTYTTAADVLTLGFQQDTPPVSDSLGTLRSFVDGRWVDSSTWEVFSGFAWVPSPAAPDLQTPLATVLNHVTADTILSVGKVAVGNGGNLSISNMFTINPIDTTPILTVNAGGTLEIDNNGDLLTPSFGFLPPTVNLYGGTLNIDSGAEIGSAFNPSFNYNIYGNADSNGVKSQININNAFLNAAILQMNSGTIHWYAGDISGPFITSEAGITNNDSFSIVTTTGVPLHMYDQILDNRKTLVIDTAAGKARTSVIIANRNGGATYFNRDTAATEIIADTFQIAAFSNITGNINLERNGVFYPNNPFNNTQFAANILGKGSLLIGANYNPFGTINFPGQDTITIQGCMYEFNTANMNISNQSDITVLAPGCGISMDTLVLDPGSTLKTVGGLTVNNYFSWGPNGESLVGSDSLIIASTANASFNSAQGFSQTTILNLGTINWTYGSISGIADSALPGGKIINNGTINAILPADGSNLVMTDQQIQNNGRIYVSAAGGGQLQFNKQFNAATQFNNNAAGRVVVAGGVFDRNIPGLEDGVDSVAAGAVYQLGVAGLVFTNALYSNSGSITGDNMELAGVVAQTVGGNGSIDSLQIDNAQGVGLGGNQTIEKSLVLTRGNLSLHAFNLVVSDSLVPGQASLQGGSSTSYVVADGGGFLEQEVSNTGSAVVFPIGTSGSYLPATVSLAPGSPNYTIGASLYDSVYSAYNSSDLPVGAGISTDAVERTWVLRPFRTTETGSPVATVSLQWNPADEATGFLRGGNLQLAHYTGGAWNAGPNLLATGSDPYVLTRSGLTSFSPFGIFSGGLPLPVTLLDFTGQTVRGGNLLQWQTSSEINNDHFVVQRSATGSSFTALGLVAGNGTSSIVNDYQFLDSMPFAGDNFYRLQQVDMNGNSAYSQIVLLGGTGGRNSLTLYPNPATEVLNIVVPSDVSPGEMQINLYDGMGQLALSGLYNNTGAGWPLNISLLKPGVYTVILYQGKTREIGRFIKE
jgi:hypothetical protein